MNFYSQEGFDLFGDNLFDSLIDTAEPETILEGEPPVKRKAFHTDHDYYAHKSPSEHSDSGVSLVSDDSNSLVTSGFSSSNMTDDQLEKIASQDFVSFNSDSLLENSPSPKNHIYDLFGFVDFNDSKNSGNTNQSMNSPGHEVEDLDFSNSIQDEDFSVDFGMYMLLCYELNFPTYDIVHPVSLPLGIIHKFLIKSIILLSTVYFACELLIFLFAQVRLFFHNMGENYCEGVSLSKSTLSALIYFFGSQNLKD